MSESYEFIPYRPVDRGDEDPSAIARKQFEDLERRRSVRQFSNRPVASETIELLLKSAGRAPSGANKQPWTFCAISDREIKSSIRRAAETEERENYENRMSEQWLEDLAPLGTDWRKPFLETAPWLIAVFKKPYDLIDGVKRPNYYVNESVGIACGFLIHGIHRAGLVTLTHTPSPMNFLSDILDRPDNERPFLLLPVGYPAADAEVPDIEKKTLEEIAAFYR